MHRSDLYRLRAFLAAAQEAVEMAAEPTAPAVIAIAVIEVEEALDQALAACGHLEGSAPPELDTEISEAVIRPLPN